MAEKRSSRKATTDKKFKCDHCKFSNDELKCNLYECNNAGVATCSKYCCHACAYHMDKSVASTDGAPSNTDIVCSSCASQEQKANWWLMNPPKGNANGKGQGHKKRQKLAAKEQQSAGFNVAESEVRGGLY